VKPYKISVNIGNKIVELGTLLLDDVISGGEFSKDHPYSLLLVKVGEDGRAHEFLLSSWPSNVVRAQDMSEVVAIEA
jgi:hypothetical protein